MGRYLTWSVVLHILVLAGGAVIAPLSGIFGSTYKPTQIIPVALVDFPNPPKSKPVEVPRPQIPTPAGDETIAMSPEEDLTLQKIEEKEPEPEVPDKPKEDETGDAGNQDKAGNADTLLAQVDTVAEVSHSISEGGTDGDIWGVEVAPNINPYYTHGYAQIRSNWRNPVVGPVGRKCTVRFRVSRSGEITDIELEQSSGLKMFDQSCLRAVRYTRSWDAFPSFWEENEQIIHLEFEYRPN